MKHLKKFNELFAYGAKESDVEKWVEYLLANKLEETFDQFGVELPSELEGDEYEQKMEEVRQLANEYYTKNCHEIEFDKIQEKKKWIGDIDLKKGVLKKSLGKDEDEKLTKGEINKEISKLKKKDKDPEKEGVQLDKKDATKMKRLRLAKTFSKMKKK